MPRKAIAAAPHRADAASPHRFIATMQPVQKPAGRTQATIAALCLLRTSLRLGRVADTLDSMRNLPLLQQMACWRSTHGPDFDKVLANAPNAVKRQLPGGIIGKNPNCPGLAAMTLAKSTLSRGGANFWWSAHPMTTNRFLEHAALGSCPHSDCLEHYLNRCARRSHHQQCLQRIFMLCTPCSTQQCQALS